MKIIHFIFGLMLVFACMMTQVDSKSIVSSNIESISNIKKAQNYRNLNSYER